MKVLYLPIVRIYLQELSQILYEKDYFAYIETAENYVKELLDSIAKTLPSSPSKLAPDYFKRYGKNLFYVTLRKSKTTQWYVFYNVYQTNGETIFLVRYISNNHVSAQYL